MSKTVDERVVEMRFDNRHFEKNVSTTLSTLEKLKSKLNFSGSAKGLDEVNAAAKKVDMNNLARGVETVHARFSALEVMGVTALANITNSAINTGKRVLSALTIQPVTTGFSEYEMKMDSIKTIMASTGASVETVNKYLEELNEYSDQTIYSFSDMTQNIGKFTNAGVKLEDAVLAIKGISNEAAVSGANANEASRAMYNFAQALSAGHVKLVDWKSIELANMATVEFKEQLLESAVATGTLTKGADGLYKTLSGETLSATKNFNETLQEQWLTTDVLIGTLKDYADNTTEIGKKAFAAAQDVTKFSQMWDVLKETAQSGWAKTWEIIFGNIEQAKAIFTPLTNFFSSIIQAMDDFRNNLIAGAMGTPFGKLTDKILNVVGVAKDVTDVVDSATDKVKKLDQVVSKVMMGDYGTGQTRWEKLTKEGFNWAEVQNKINEEMGSSVRHSLDLGKAQDDLNKSQEELNKTKAETVEELVKMEDSQLKELGFTQKEIESFRELEAACDKAGISVSSFVEDTSQLDGRTLLINSFKNAAQGVVAVFKAMKEAWVDIFPPMTSKQLYDIIAGLHNLSTNLIVDEEAAGKFARTFKGVFAALDIVLTIVGGPLKIAFKALTQLLGMFDMDLLDVTAAIGDAIVKFHDWLDGVLDFTKIFEAIMPTLKDVAVKIRDWFNEIKNSDIAQGIIDGLVNGLNDGAQKVWNKAIEIGKSILTAVKNVLGIHSPSTEFFEVGKNIIEGLVNGIKFAVNLVINTIKDIGLLAINVLGSLNSKSAFTTGNGLVGTFAKGIKSGLDTVTDTITKIVSAISDLLSKIDFGAVFAGGISGGTLFMLVKIGKAVEAIASPFEGLGDIFEETAGVVKNAAKVVKSFSGVLKSFSMSIKAKALKDIAIALVILVGAITVLTFLDMTKVEQALDVIFKLAIIIAGLSIVISTVGKASKGIGDMVAGLANIAKVSGLVLAVSAALLMLAGAVKMMSGVSQDGFTKTLAMIGVFGLVVSGILAVSTLATDKDISSASKLIKNVAVAMLLMAVVARIVAGMSIEDMTKAGVAISAFSVIIFGLVAMAKNSKKLGMKQLGSLIRNVGVAMLLMAWVARIISGMTWGEMLKAGVGILGFTGIIALLIKITDLATDKKLKKVGDVLLAAGGAMLMMAVVARIISGMSWDEMGKAAVGIVVLAGVIVTMVKTLGSINVRELTKVGSTLLMMSISVGILGVISMMLSLLSIPALAKGIVAVSILSSMVAIMARSTKDASDVKGTMIAISIAIAAMTISVAALAMIDPGKLAGATVALSLLMGMFALIVKSTQNVKSSVVALATIIIAVGALSYILYKLSELDPEASIRSAVALSVLLVAVSASLTLLSKFSGTAKQALTGVLALTAMAIPLLAFVGVLVLMRDIQNAMTNVQALVLLTSALTLLLIPLTIVGSFAVSALFGVLALTAMAVPLLAFVGVLALMENLENATANTEALTKLMTTMTFLLVALTIVGPLAMIGVGAMAALTGLMVGVGLLAVAIGALMTYFPDLEKFLDRGLPVLEKIAHGIGSFVGNLVGGFLEGMASGLPEIGTTLSSFMKNVKPFIDGVKMVDEQVVTGVTTLTKAILALTAAELINSVASFLTEGSSFATLGAELSAFMINAKPFIEGASKIDSGVTESVQNIADAIMVLTKADILEGLTSWLTGGSSLSDFGKELAEFGPNMATYAESVAGIDTEAVRASAYAAKTLAQMANTIPETGGLLGGILGNNDIDTFGSQLEKFGISLKKYSLAVTGIETGPIDTSIVAAKALAGVADAIPNFGGLLAFFTGDNDLATFGNQLVVFGHNLMRYGLAVTGLDNEPIRNSIAAAKMLSGMAEDIPNFGGLVDFFTGGNDLATFGTQLVTFGTNLMAYSTEVTGLDTQPIVNSVYAAKCLANLSKVIPESGVFVSNDLANFAKDITPFGVALNTYGTSVSGINIFSIKSSVYSANLIANMIRNVSDIDKKDGDGFKQAINSLANTNISGFINTFKDAKPDIKSIGADLMDSLIKGMESKKTPISVTVSAIIIEIVKNIRNKKETFKTLSVELANHIVDNIRNKYQSFYNAGSYLVTGFATGISDNAYKAEAKSRAMAKAAAQAAEDELDIQSPSRVGREIGDFFGMGFVKGIGDYTDKAYSMSAEMASSARSGLSQAISKISDIINSDMDTQPTIRPVLDLSEIKSRAGAISGMLGSSTVGLTANAGAINAMMNSRGQNGVNDDVISAIDKLRHDVNNMERSSYTIGGITYDDGSNVANAVKTLVRAAKIERRV